ncbi:GTP cyclohydrolase 1 [Trichonephila clavipes]|uniref:GTP cyclohydrolase 1 n=1 Tax=Trichonephila clavipes TaxID=2585209 RepID=A0A8X6VAS9_TRICX|nr:GTP cyclohydrolase 1 [Trichonephila clavipes]
MLTGHDIVQSGPTQQLNNSDEYYPKDEMIMDAILLYINWKYRRENLIGFLAVTETTGEYLTNAILGKVEENGLDNQNCRGQGYDYGANMIGINRGVKTRILMWHAAKSNAVFARRRIKVKAELKLVN